MMLMVPAGLAICELTILHMHQEAEILNCCPGFLLHLTEFHHRRIEIQAGEGAKGRVERRQEEGVIYRGDLWCAVGACLLREPWGCQEKGQTPWGLSGKIHA